MDQKLHFVTWLFVIGLIPVLSLFADPLKNIALQDTKIVTQPTLATNTVAINTVPMQNKALAQKNISVQNEASYKNNKPISAEDLLIADKASTEQDKTKHDKAVSRIEKSRRSVYSGAIDFANWVDQFFGENEELESANYDYLRLVNNVILVDGESVSYRPRIKAKIHLPQLSDKTSLIFSNNKARATNNFDFNENINQPLAADDDNKLSAAFNYTTDFYAKSKFDFRAGLDSSLDTFAFVKHSFSLVETDDLQIRNFNYLFWEQDIGFGLSTELQLNKILDENTLFRWKYTLLRAQRSDGNEWYNKFSLINRITEQKWLTYEFRMNGDTEHSYKVENYRFSVRFRNRTSVDWLYFEIEPQVRYIRTPESIDRELIAAIIFRLEIQFE